MSDDRTNRTTTAETIRALKRRAVHDTRTINHLALELKYPTFRLKQHKLWKQAVEMEAQCASGKSAP